MMRNLFAMQKAVPWRSTVLLAVLGLGPVFSAKSASVTFDFDTGAPALTTGQSVPFDQTSGGITAHFSSPQGSVFSIQTGASTGWTLSQFSGKFLNDNNLNRNALDIQFSQPLSSITLTFATADFDQTELATTIQLTAYTNTTATPAVGTASIRGTYASDTMPMGTLSFTSNVPFNLIELVLPPQPLGVTDFLVDNIIVTPIPKLAISLTKTNAAVISWPSPSTGYRLRQNTDLGTTSWMDVAAGVDVINGSNLVTVPLSGAQCFYRLTNP